MTAKLFGRAYRLVVGELDVSSLDIRFEVKKTLKPEPNTCDLRIYNLSEESRKKLETPKGGKLAVRLDAGYEDQTSQIYLGEVRSAQSSIDDADIVTELTTGDGEKAIHKARLTRPIGPGAKTGDVLLELCKALGVGMGNASQVASKLASKGFAQVHGKTGSVLHGRVADQITDLCRSCNLEWSIQDGNIQILDRGFALQGKSILLSGSSGLIESPTVDTNGVLEATCLMIPDLRPGVLVTVDTLGVKGGYRVTHVTYTGDTRGTEWYAKIHGKRY